jgi:hypothetical protein
MTKLASRGKETVVVIPNPMARHGPFLRLFGSHSSGGFPLLFVNQCFNVGLSSSHLSSSRGINSTGELAQPQCVGLG